MTKGGLRHMMNFFRKRLNKKGFTLVELLIVIAVLGIIAGIGVTSMSGVTNTFKKKADAETAEMLGRNVEIMVMAGKTFADADAVTTALGDTLTNTESQVTKKSFIVSAYASGTVTFSDNGGDDANTYPVTIATAKVE